METPDARGACHGVPSTEFTIQPGGGVDIGNDGEQSRVGFQTYVPRCMCGFGGESKRPPARDQVEVPSYVRQTAARFPHSARVANAPAALSPVEYVNAAPIREDAERLRKLGTRFSETFMTAPSPGIVATTMINQHYDSHEAYLMVLASALANEYRAIHEAGHVLQIDAPDLAMERHRFFGHLDAQGGATDDATLRKAMTYGSAVASFWVEEFGCERAERLAREDIEARYEAFRGMTSIEGVATA